MIHREDRFPLLRLLFVNISAMVIFYSSAESLTAAPRPSVAWDTQEIRYVGSVTHPIPSTMPDHVSVDSVETPAWVDEVNAALLKREEFYRDSQIRPEMFRTPPVPADPTDGAPEALQAFQYSPRLTRVFRAITEPEAGGVPPDPHIAAGSNHVVSIVNVRIRAFRKHDGTLVLDAGLARFFCTDGGADCGDIGVRPGPFDPKVVYDPQSERYFAVALGRQETCTTLQSFLYIAVSSSSDPSDEWNLFHMQINRNGEWGDYPSLGFGDRAVYVAVNYISGCCACPGLPCPRCPGWTGAGAWNAVWFLEKEALTAGEVPDNIWRADSIRDEAGNLFQTLRPTLTYGSPPAGFDAFLLSFNNIDGVRKASVWGMTLPSDFPTAPPSLTLRSVQLPAPPPLVLAGQRGGPGLILTWTIGAPPFEAVYRNNRIWTSTHQGAGGSPERTALRDFEINVQSWPTLSLESTGTFWDGISFYYWPGLTANQFGDVAMVFSRSRATVGADAGEFPGSRWTMRLKEESTLIPSQWLAAGEHYYGDEVNDQAGVCTSGICTAGTNIGNACTQNFQCTPQYRWGDYAGIAVDPVDQGFWMFHEYSIEDPNSRDNGMWAAQVGYVPRAVFVDRGYTGAVQTGSRPRPYRTVGLGHFAALPGNDLVIRTGNYPERVTLSKPVAIIPDGGSVIIGE